MGEGLCGEVKSFCSLEEEDEGLAEKRNACVTWIVKNGKEEFIRLALLKNLIPKALLENCVEEALEEPDGLRRAMMIPLLLQRKWRED